MAEVNNSTDQELVHKLNFSHQELVHNLSKPGHEILNDMSCRNAELWHMATGVSGESGELLDAVKKHVIYKKPLDRENMIEELGDIEFFLEGIRQLLGLSREETLTHNIAKLTHRYGEKYSNQAAQERKDKQ